MFGGTQLSDMKPSCRRLRSSNLSRGGKRDPGEPRGGKGEADYLLTGSEELRTSTEPQEATNRIRRAETESRTTAAAAAAGDDGKESALAPSSSSPRPHALCAAFTDRSELSHQAVSTEASVAPPAGSAGVATITDVFINHTVHFSRVLFFIDANTSWTTPSIVPENKQVPYSTRCQVFIVHPGLQ